VNRGQAEHFIRRLRDGTISSTDRALLSDALMIGVLSVALSNSNDFASRGNPLRLRDIPFVVEVAPVKSVSDAVINSLPALTEKAKP
jgi:hypothetical protein